MSLQNVLNFITINNGSAGANFTHAVTAALTRIYNESTFLRAALEGRIVTGRALTFDYVPGFGQNHHDNVTGSDTILIDPVYADSLINIDQFGNSDAYGFLRLLIHELCHAMTGLKDGNDGFLSQGFSFLGPNVYYENLVLAEMGIDDLRIGYFSVASNIFDFLPSYTEGSQIGYAYMNTGNIGYIDASLSIESSLNGLLIGLDGSEAFDGGTGNDYIHGMSGNDQLSGHDGNDILYGGDGNDILKGGSGNDRIYGGSGSDAIFGDAGSDTIDGDSGLDVVDYKDSEASITVNFKTGTGIGGYADGDTFFNIEAVNGSAYNDEFIFSGKKVEIFSGGDGDDVFHVVAGGGSPAIIWGGVGADTIAITSGTQANAAGILVLTCDNIDENNFHLIDLESLGFGNDFDWTAIDVVIVNPDSSDKISLDGEDIRVNNQTMYYRDAVSATMDQEVFDAFISAGYFHEPFGDGERGILYKNFDVVTFQLEDEGSAVFTYNASFLGGSGHQIYTPNGGRQIMAGQEIWWHPDVDPDLIELQHYNVPVEALVQPMPIEVSYTRDGEDQYYKYALHLYVSGYYVLPDGYGYPIGGVMIEPIDDYGSPINFGILSADSINFTTSETLNRWFIVGGSISDTSIISGFGQHNTYSFTITDPESVYGEELPHGGSYGNGSKGSNLNTGDGTNRLGGFDPAKQTIVLDGDPLSAATLTQSMTATEADGSTVIKYGNGDFIVLRGIALTDWQTGSAAQIHGDAGDDSIIGTSTDDVIASGGGNDTISAGAGDDRINYSSGNTVILGDSENLGNDLLDLSRFNEDEISFKISGNDVLITALDGTVLLQDQVLYDLGNIQSNVETILLADSTIDEAGIRERAVYDQGTSGDDSIHGTAFDDRIIGGTGNDTLQGNAGADDFIFTWGDGHDLIMDFSLTDDRVVFQYHEMSDLTVTQVGNNTLITFGEDDSVTLLDILAANLQTHHYDFVW